MLPLIPMPLPRSLSLHAPKMSLYTIDQFTRRHFAPNFKLRSTRSVSTAFKSLDRLPNSVTSWIDQMKLVHSVEEDRVDVSRVKQLFYTLPNRQAAVKDNSIRANAGQPLPLGHHLILFPPVIPESELNADGTDPTYNSPHPFTRRMWAGGSFEFDPQHVLRIGEDVTCETTVSSVDYKHAGNEPMIFVNQLRRIQNAAENTAMVERRTHVFLRPPEGGIHLARSPSLSLDSAVSQYTFSCTPTPATLFRFSALTFNSHYIHLDPEFSRNVDGHPDRLVHGPLIALMLLDIAAANIPPGRSIASFTYRARHPVIVNRSLTFGGSWSSSGGKGWAINDTGRVCMTAELVLR